MKLLEGVLVVEEAREVGAADATAAEAAAAVAPLDVDPVVYGVSALNLP